MSEPAKPKNPRDTAPSAALKRLGDMLVGTWQLSGGAEGTIRYEWMEGGRFLIQHVDLKAFGRQIRRYDRIRRAERRQRPALYPIRHKDNDRQTSVA